MQGRVSDPPLQGRDGKRHKKPGMADHPGFGYFFRYCLAFRPAVSIFSAVTRMR